MKTGLTQRGWNNVLIFASLFMIILFNSTHQKFTDGDNEVERSSLIDVNAIIQSIDFSGIKIERIGASWRTVNTSGLVGNISTEQIIQSWQYYEFTKLVDAPQLMASISRYPVIIFAHGYEQAQLFEIILEPQSDLAYAFNKITAQWFVMNYNEASMLIPEPLL